MVLSIAMLASMGSVFAEDVEGAQSISELDIQEEIEKAKSGITDVKISQEVLDSIKATSITEDGVVSENFEIKATQTLLSKTNTYSDQSISNYAITVYATPKSETDSGTSGSQVRCSAVLTVYYTDYGFKDKEINQVTGSWIPDSSYDTVKNRNVSYGQTPGLTHQYPSSNSFNYRGISIRGGTFGLDIKSSASVLEGFPPGDQSVPYMELMNLSISLI